MTQAPLFLIINTANIGDLLVSTPTIRALRKAFPGAQIDALVNSYNAPVIANNSDINHVYCYTKAKHRESNQTILGVHWSRLRMLWKLRRARYDYILLAGNGFSVRPYRLARLVGARHLIGFRPDDYAPPGMNMPVKLTQPDRHEVIKMLDLLAPLAIKLNEPPRMVLQPAPRATQLAKDALLKLFPDLSVRVVAIHVSARLTSQRWPAERFVELIHRLNRDCACHFMLFWSPGDENDPRHPGDDKKAATIIDQCLGLPLLAYPTRKLEELIGGLSNCQAMFCSDGGAMHIGAALGLPIVCLFGDSIASNWYPWGVQHQVLQPESRNVCDVSVDEAYAACRRTLIG